MVYIIEWQQKKRKKANPEQSHTNKNQTKTTWLTWLNLVIEIKEKATTEPININIKELKHDN